VFNDKEKKQWKELKEDTNKHLNEFKVNTKNSKWNKEDMKGNLLKIQKTSKILKVWHKKSP
jgi:hypothetical protein